MASPSVSGKTCNLVSVVSAAERTPSKSSFLFILAGSHNGAVDICSFKFKHEHLLAVGKLSINKVDKHQQERVTRRSRKCMASSWRLLKREIRKKG